MSQKNLPFTLPIAGAVSLAVDVHGTQVYGDEPYLIGHLMEVDRILCQYGYTDDLTRMLGYLHDSLEDCASEIRDDVAKSIAQLDPDLLFAVEFCSDEEGKNRKERKAKTYARIKRFTQNEILLSKVKTAIRGKVADRLANLRSSVASNPGLLSMYVKENPAFRDALYVPGVCDAMWEEYDSLVRRAP